MSDISVSPTSNLTTTSSAAPELQWLREGMAIVISVVILLLAAYTMYGTFTAAGQLVPVELAKNESLVKAQTEAYNRQKDIMLYALALFGTVTGYYLGRVPAEANAKRAERSADTAQSQLAMTQERLVDTSTSASVANAQAGRANEEKTKALASLRESTRALREVSTAISAARKTRDSSAPKGWASASGSSSLLAESGPKDGNDDSDDLLKRAQERVDTALSYIDAQSMT